MRTPTAIALVVLTLAALPLAARASGTRPVLFASATDAFASASGVRSVTVTGEYSFDDRLQFGFPVGVIVYQGTRFAVFDASGAATAGTSAAVADGVDDKDVADVLAAGTPAAAPAGLLQLRPDSMTVTLPPGFTAGAASVVLYAQQDDKSFASNVLSVVLP